MTTLRHRLDKIEAECNPKDVPTAFISEYGDRDPVGIDMDGITIMREEGESVEAMKARTVEAAKAARRDNNVPQLAAYIGFMKYQVGEFLV